MYISNCIFWENSPAFDLFSDADPAQWEMEGYHIDHVFINWPEELFLLGSIGPHAAYLVNPMFADTTNNDFHLLPCSPAINFGDNQTASTAGLVLDIEGNPRVFRDTVDLGAFETQDTCATVAVEEALQPEESLLVWPNPVSANSTLEVAIPALETDDQFQWKIYDMYGRVSAEGRYSGSALCITAPRGAGVYWLVVFGKKLQQVMRLVVAQ